MILKNHPFAVEAFFDTSLVLTYALPAEVLLKLIPEPFELDLFDNKWAFLAVAVVQTSHLRPKGFPKLMGTSFVLIGYRIFVRYKDVNGKSLRGLYILKSETNKSSMGFLGNLFTHYNYTVTDVALEKNENQILIKSLNSGLDILVNSNEVCPPLPANSPFKSWSEARRFAGPLPFTFHYNKTKHEVLIIKGLRSNWTPKPVSVLKERISFINNDPFSMAILANAFVVENIPYNWSKGKLEIWKQQ